MHAPRGVVPAVLAATLAIARPAAQPHPDRAALPARIAAYFAPLVLDQQVSGSLLIADHGRPVYERSYGQANYELAVPNRADTVFAIASITKIMTFAMTTQLVEERVLLADEPIAKWLPDFPRGTSITVRHLLEHRSGIPHRVTSGADEAVEHSAADVVALAASRPLLFEPGSEAVYSSAGYTVLARVLELATGQSYAELVRSRVFARAGMTSSFQPAANEIIPRRAVDYLASWPGVRRAPLKDLSFLTGAGSVYSTPRDLLRFLVAVRDGRLGAAVSKSATVDRDVILWQGSNGGFRSFISDDRRSGISVIFTGNLRSGALDRLSADLPKLAGGTDIPPPARLTINAIGIGATSAPEYAGSYDVHGETWRSVVDDQLLLLGGRTFVPVAPDRFFAIDDYGELRAVRDDQGRLIGFDWTSKGTTLRCPKRQ